MGIPFYHSANLKRQALVRRRRRWIVNQIRGASRMSVKGLMVEFNTLFPDRTVSIRTFTKDMRYLRDTETVCCFCHQPVTVDRLVGEDKD